VLLRDVLIQYLAGRSLRSSSAEQLALACRSLDLFLGRPALLSDLTAATLAAFLHAYLAHHAASTTNSKRRAILTLARWASKRGLACQNCPADVPTAREPRRIPLAWTVDEIERLVAAARGWPGCVGTIPARLFWPSLFLATYDTGCRIGALRSARSVDLSMANRSLVIQPEATKTNVGCCYWLHDQTIAAIAGHYDLARELVWPWPHCRRLFWTATRRIVEKAGLVADRRGMSLYHKIRRTCISYCATVDLALAQQQAGHSDARLTARCYIDPRIARRQSAVDVLPRPDL